jgi:preprotein translocase subunit YajC
MFSSPAYAQAAGAGAPASGGFAAFSMFIPMVLVIVIFFVIVELPRRKQVKAHRARLDAAKKGDTVVTAGGLIGKVIKVEPEEVELELGPNVRVRAVKSTLTEVRGAKPAND